MFSRTPQRILVFGVCLWSLLISCNMPTHDNPLIETYSDINIISTDGSGHRIISPQRSYYLHLLITQYGIVLSKENFSLYTMKYDGSTLARLYPSIPWGERSLSPDESKILLTSWTIDNTQAPSNLFLMNSDGTNLVQLAPPKGIYNFPHISPHFDEIAFMRDGGIATISTDGSNLQWIRTKTDSTSCITPLYIDQNRILYTEGSSAEMSLRLFDKLRRQDTVIAYLSSGVGYDGRAFVRGKLVYNYLNVIKILDVNALTSRNLAKGYEPSFSSDGSRIVFRDDRSIYTMNSDGSNQKTLYSEPDSSRYVATPQFSADDKNIIFITSYTVITP